MPKFSGIALPVVVVAFGAAAAVSAQTSPASAHGMISIRGCVAPVQRDGSLASKPGATATPETAPMEANSQEPTGTYVLLAATTPSQPRPTSFALFGHETELAKYNGTRIEVTGSVVPKATAGRGEKGAAPADAIQHVRVASVKKIGGGCSATKK